MIVTGASIALTSAVPWSIVMADKEDRDAEMGAKRELESFASGSVAAFEKGVRLFSNSSDRRRTA